jgi:DNA-binding CsgD family transcriptional regulator
MPLGKPLLDVLERMGMGGLVLDGAGQVSQLNGPAKRLLRERDGASARREADPDWGHALASVLCSRSRINVSKQEEAWDLLGDRSDPSGPVVMHSIPIRDPAAYARVVVILVELNAAFQPAPEALQKIFGLTPTESRIAVEMAKGKSLEEIATATQVALGTVRKQLASIYAKTGTHRQAQLVALLARISVLP